MGEVPKVNPYIPFTGNNASIPAPTSGTVGVKESVEVVSIPNVGATVDAPKNEPAGHFAVNQYDKN